MQILIFFSSIFLDIVRPLTIKLEQDVKYLSANRSYELKCEVSGSRPTPLITWYAVEHGTLFTSLQVDDEIKIKFSLEFISPSSL